MSEAEAARRPGRPSSGARERVLEAGLEVLMADGYAGLTTAKVAARSGQNKALISYHFGSKQGLVAAVGHELSEAITEELLDHAPLAPDTTPSEGNANALPAPLAAALKRVSEAMV